MNWVPYHEAIWKSPAFEKAQDFSWLFYFFLDKMWTLGKMWTLHELDNFENTSEGDRGKSRTFLSTMDLGYLIYTLLLVLLLRIARGEKFVIPSNEPKNKLEWQEQAKKTIDKLKGTHVSKCKKHHLLHLSNYYNLTCSVSWEYGVRAKNITVLFKK